MGIDSVLEKAIMGFRITATLALFSTSRRLLLVSKGQKLQFF